MPSRLPMCVCVCVHGKAGKISLSRRQSSNGGPPTTKISFIIKLIGPRDVWVICLGLAQKPFTCLAPSRRLGVPFFPIWGHACAAMQLQLLPRWAPARYQKLITQVAAIVTICMTHAVIITHSHTKRKCVCVCVWECLNPTLGAHMEILIKFWYYLEQERDTLGAKLIWSVHTHCVPRELGDNSKKLCQTRIRICLACVYVCCVW